MEKRKMRFNSAIRQRKQIVFGLSIIATTVCLSACAVGPDYVKPAVVVPPKYKEAPKNWKIAEPQDEHDRGPWWETFHDRELNKLEETLNISNQTIAAAVGQYYQARAIVDESRASFFPTLSGNASITRQKSGASSSAGRAGFSATSTSASTTTSSTGSSTSTGASSGSISTGKNPANSHTLAFSATWEPDIWGAVRRTVEASAAGAQASAASLAAIRLSSQALLAQTYFQLRALDNDQKILDDTVKADHVVLTYTKNRFAAGVAGEADMIQAKTQLEMAEAAAINNGILRAQDEHAIAVLIGMPPADFRVVAVACAQRPPAVPLDIPSKLLERRPDVAQAERLMAQANAQVGIAVSAYYPVLTLSASGNVTNPGFAHWFSIPALSWALGSQLSETLFDGGLRNATVTAARANFDATAGTYRQTVLTAFQNVEDNLVALHLLNVESKVQDQAAKDAKHALKIVINEYKAGTVDYSAVIAAQNTALLAVKTASDVHGQQMTSAVGLINALGGGWEVDSIANAAG
jgi:NodT family efflux transporter outer membrane factor (OMF) lipoprotein